MPAMTQEEIADAIAQRRFGAVTIDTSIFDQFDCSLEARALRALGPVAAQHDVRLVFSDVTAREVQAHISRDAAGQAEKLRAAVNQYRKSWRRAETVDQLAAPVDLRADPDLLAAEEWEAFTGATGAEVIPAEGRASAGELVRRYFESAPPFSRKDSKKAEFPDAIALLALEKWAEDEDLLLLAISRDGDWKAFADASARLVCATAFAPTLDLFNAAGRATAERAVLMLRADAAPGLKDEIDLELEAWLDEADFDVEATSDFYYDASPESAVVQTWEIRSEPKVLTVEGEVVTFSLEIECLVAFRANFDLSVRDSIDGDYVGLNSQSAEVEARHTVGLTIAIGRAFEPEPEVMGIEANRRRLVVDFGEVNLQWSYEE